MPPHRQRQKVQRDPAKEKKDQKTAEDAEFEADITTVFTQLAEQDDASEEQELGLLPITDLEEAMLMLDLDCSENELTLIKASLDPESRGFATYGDFRTMCLAKRRSKPRGAASSEEADRIFDLFVQGRAYGVGDDGLTIEDLRRVSRELAGRGLRVDDSVLGDMIRVAAGLKDFDVPIDRVLVDRSQFSELMENISQVK